MAALVSAASQLAEKLNGRAVGSGRWCAHCPAHQDGSPSLRISEGREGRALLHCFAGCSPSAILTSAGLGMAALWPSATRVSPVEAAAARKAREHHRAAAVTQRQAERRRNDRLLLLWQEYDHILEALAYRLAMLPDNTPGANELSACWHALLDEQRATEQQLSGEDAWD